MIRLLTVADIAEQTQQHKRSVLGLIHRGELAAINVGSTGANARYRVDPRDLERWLESRKT